MPTSRPSDPPEPAGPPERVRALPDPGATALAVATAGLGIGLGWLAVRYAGAFHLRLSPLHLAVLLAAGGAAVLIVRRPVVGLAALSLVVYLHLSDVLIRFHGLPSILQLLAIPLLLAAVVEWRTELLRGLSPLALTVAAGAYVAVVLLSTLVAEDPGLADQRAVAVAKGVMVFVLVLLLATSAGRVRVAAWSLVAGGAILGGITVLQVLTGDYGNDFGGLARVEFAQVYGNVVEPRIAGPLGDPNFFAQILVLVVPLALLLAWKERRWWARALALAGAGVASAGTIFTYSRGGALALGVVIVLSLFAARPSRRRVALGASLLVLGLLFLPSDFTRRLETLGEFLPGGGEVTETDTSFQNRILQARVAWRTFLDYPVLGVGAANYTVHYYEYADEVGSAVSEYENIGGDHYPHNLYLEIASETGFLGLMAFGAMLLVVFGHLGRAEARYFDAGEELHAGLASGLRIALLGYLISSLFLHGHFQRYLWVLVGLSAALAREAPEEPVIVPDDGTS